MNKATITRLFTGSIIAVAAGAVVLVAAIALAVANDVFVMAGPDIVGIHGSFGGWASLGLALTGALVIAGGLIAGVVSWIGAVLNTWQLDGKGWFVGVLLLGIFNLGFFAMIAYLLAGPDGTRNATVRRGPLPTPA